MKINFLKIIKRIMLLIFSIILIFIAFVFVFLQFSMFGKTPSGKRLDRVKQSPHYKNGAFQNLNHTPDLTEGVTYYSLLKEFIFEKKIRNKPSEILPSIKTNLLTISPNEDILVWFGHSSYYIQLDGKKILVDPVFSGAASPIKFTMPSFQGTDVYSVEDFPEIDYLFISHDHWDHVDYETLQKLRPKVKKVLMGLGNGEHFEAWGFEKNQIFENDWNEKVDLDEGFEAHTVPARHFSGRGLQRNKALWTSFVLKTPTFQIFIGGDSGYDTHFETIGKKFGQFDLVILENGQYDRKWKYIHMMPDEVLQAAKDLNAKRLFPVHSSKFALANHAWDEPLTQITALNASINLPLITPIIGEKVFLKDSTQVFRQWWKGIN